MPIRSTLLRQKRDADDAQPDCGEALAAPASGPAAAGPAASMTEFRAVYDAHFAFVWRTLQRFGVPERDLADASQEVFVVVYRKLGSFEGRSKLTTWLFSICFHVGRTRSRRAHLHHEVLDDSYARASSPEQDVERGLEQRRDLDRLQSILSAMDLDHRAVFCLYELEDLTGEQIAEMLSLPLGTVYSRLRKARAIVEHNMGRADSSSRLRLRAVKEVP
jgi:RNA polymerase sigma-70 factor (ECF subfamily)